MPSAHDHFVTIISNCDVQSIIIPRYLMESSFFVFFLYCTLFHEGCGGGSTTTDRNKLTADKLTANKLTANNADWLRRAILNIFLLSPEPSCPNPHFVTKSLRRNHCNETVGSRSVFSRSVCRGQLTWLVRGQQLKIKPPHFTAFHHLHHFAWVKSQAIPSKILNVIAPCSSRSF